LPPARRHMYRRPHEGVNSFVIGPYDAKVAGLRCLTLCDELAVRGIAPVAAYGQILVATDTRQSRVMQIRSGSRQRLPALGETKGSRKVVSPVIEACIKSTSSARRRPLKDPS